MGAQSKVVINRSPWDRYATCTVCGAPAGSPCNDMRRIDTYLAPHHRVQPHPQRGFEPRYTGPLTWPGST